MDSAFFWQMFLETGAPEMYLFYNEAKRTEEGYVSDSTGIGSAGNTL